MTTMTELQLICTSLKAERDQISDELDKIIKEFDKKEYLVKDKLRIVYEQMGELERQEDEKRRIEEFKDRTADSIKYKEFTRIPLSIAKEVVEIYKRGKIIWSLDHLQETPLLTGLKLRDEIIDFLKYTYADRSCSYCDSIFHQRDDCTVKCRACDQSGHSIKTCMVPISQLFKYH
jgi:hypothetical protein